MSLDIDVFSNEPDWVNVTLFTVDKEGNIYIGTGGGFVSDATIYVLDTNGRTLFTLVSTTWTSNFIEAPDGSVMIGRQRDFERTLQKIDVANKTWGGSVDIPFIAHTVFSGNNQFSFVFSDGSSIYGINKETGEASRMLSFFESGILPVDADNIVLLPDGRIVLLTTQRDWNPQTHEIIIFTPVKRETDSPNTSLSERTILTIGTLRLTSELQHAVAHFNNTSTAYFMQIIDYSTHVPSGDIAAALTRMSTEFIAGRFPDVLYLFELPFQQYVRRDILEDLYPFLDADPVLSRESLISNVLSAIETDGGLYRVISSFGISTILGNPSILGSFPGWNMDDLKATLEAHPQADTPLGPRIDNMMFLSWVFYHNMDEYIDWESGTAHFDNNDFIALLEFANTLPAEGDWDMSYTEHMELIAAGRQIMEALSFGDFEYYKYIHDRFGGDIIFKGWPSANRDGNKFVITGGFAVTAGASDINGAWDFVRTILTEEFQREPIHWSFPINKAVFEEQLGEAMTTSAQNPRPEDVLSQKAADQLLNAIDSITRITGHGAGDVVWNLVSESAMDFFNGQITAQEAARIIQSRVSIYVAEQR
jgi:hypothetical protein